MLVDGGQLQIIFTFFGDLVLENNIIESAFRDQIEFLLILSHPYQSVSGIIGLLLHYL